MTDGDMNETIAVAWRETATALGVEPGEDGSSLGVSYGGPNHDQPWTAWLQRDGRPEVPEGWGRAPAEALANLVEAVRRGTGHWPSETESSIRASG